MSEPSHFSFYSLLLLQCWGDSFSAHGTAGKARGALLQVVGRGDRHRKLSRGAEGPGALESAHAVAAALRELGFDEVIELQDKDASSKRLLQILNDYLPRKVGRQDRVVIFLCRARGVAQDSQSKELGYLVPWDAPVN